MDRTNDKIVSLAFIVAGIITWLIAQTLIQTLGATGAWGARIVSNDFARHVVPVMLGVALFGYLRFNSKTFTWADEVVAELRKVIWPPRKDLAAMTGVVVVMVLISSLVISLFDFLSAYVINGIVK